MADFARVLAALDTVLGSKALECYLGQRGRVVAEVLDADPVAGTIHALTEGGNWSGTPNELLGRITPADGRRPDGWPKNPRALTARLHRLMPSLRQIGIAVHIPKERSNRGKIITLSRTEELGKQPSRQSPQSPWERQVQ